jgi:hypothetical protein
LNHCLDLKELGSPFFGLTTFLLTFATTISP